MMNSTLGKLLYGALFTVALPVLLVVWAIETRDLVKLPAIHSLSWGIGTIAVGSLLVALGMASLWCGRRRPPHERIPSAALRFQRNLWFVFASDLSRLFAGVHRRCNRCRLRQWLVAGLHHV